MTFMGQVCIFDSLARKADQARPGVTVGKRNIHLYDISDPKETRIGISNPNDVASKFASTV